MRDIMIPRIKRLQADYEEIKDKFTGHPYIQVEADGKPPDRYKVIYKIEGIKCVEDNLPKYAAKHVIEIYLSANYPREKPRIEPKTKIFHPNFGTYVCYGDHWTPAESLTDLIIKIGRMIQYQIFNTTKPLNQDAANWAEKNKQLFPVDNKELVLPEPEITIYETT